MTAGLSALADQIEAADRHAVMLAGRVAAESGEPVERSRYLPVHDRLPDRMMGTLSVSVRTGQGMFCPHVSRTAPGVAIWQAWAAGRIRCMTCADRSTERIKGSREDHRCDACQRVRRHGLKRGTVVMPGMVLGDPPVCAPSILVLFGICGRCLSEN